jgi:ATP-dependent Lhr-like helicase
MPRLPREPSAARPKPPVDPLASFHPLVSGWFRERLGAPSAPQVEGWPRIRAGGPVLIAAPTGSGKTLAAFLSCLDELVREAAAGTLPKETRVVYVSPLKALGNDVQKNLLGPLEEIRARAAREGGELPEIRVGVRTGDTPAGERARMLRHPPHVLITTPESLYLVLTSAKARDTLRPVRTVIVDEIHALARDKRGSHLALSLERLKRVATAPPQLIGLSATQKPIEEIASFLVGSSAPHAGRIPPVNPGSCALVQAGHKRAWELAVEVPDDELGAVASHELWGQVYDRIRQHAASHRTTLVFVNTRKLAERVAHDLGERMGVENVAAHHGSMSKELRLAAEERLKSGTLRVMVATASLELGIDVGSVDLVCQLGSPRSIAVFLQRAGRAGHRNDAVSKALLFAMTRDELVECVAVLDAVRRGELDAVIQPEQPLDVLSQQIVAACATEDWTEDALFELVRRSWPYRALERAEFDAVITMLSEGISTSRGRRRAHLHRDRVHGRLRARPGARTLALLNAGAIPDTFAVQVVEEPHGRVVGSLDEDFAIESTAGDVFVLGSTSWRVRRLSGGVMRVENAHGAPPSIPFWIAEAPSRTKELSSAVARLREELLARPDSMQFLVDELRLGEHAASGLLAYLRAGVRSLGAVPSQTEVIAERFFDESGGMQLVIHAPFGGRVNRAWGLAVRKRFCRQFDFELQAAATDDGILLSLGEKHSFPLADIFRFVPSRLVEEILTQAILQIPLFGTRFRWNATRALALERTTTNGRVPPIIQRARSEDLLASVFPDQVACQDNLGGGDIAVPDHPLVSSTLEDCLHEALDVDGLREVLEGIESGAIRTRSVDVPEPSPFAHAILNSAPYTFLDEAPLEERRARAVSLRRTLAPEDAAAFGALDPEAIARVVLEAQPAQRTPDEFHEALLQLVLMPEDEADPALLAALVAEGRAARLLTRGRPAYVVSAERIPHAVVLLPRSTRVPDLLPLKGDPARDPETALLDVVRGRLEICGPTTPDELAGRIEAPIGGLRSALWKLESEGQVLRGRFRSGATEDEFCDRRLLQRIHRLTVGRLRAAIEPLTASEFMRFLLRRHHVDGHEPLAGRGGLRHAVMMLEGFEAPASAWEAGLLKSRVVDYAPDLLDLACMQGEVAWARLTLRDRPPEPGPSRGAVVASPGRRVVATRNAPLTFVRREKLAWMLGAVRDPEALAGVRADLSQAARDLLNALEARGALFFDDLVAASHRVPSEVEDALGELVAHGVVNADGASQLRSVLGSKAKTGGARRHALGRWSVVPAGLVEDAPTRNERVARVLLERYGIVWRDLAVREPLCPAWRELLQTFRRLEARGEIRGGRFVSGFNGEQFALPGVVDEARALRRTKPDGAVVRVSACDPLNLTGVVTPGPRVPAIPGRFVTFVDGVPTDDAPPVAPRADLHERRGSRPRGNAFERAHPMRR